MLAMENAQNVFAREEGGREEWRERGMEGEGEGERMGGLHIAEHAMLIELAHDVLDDDLYVQRLVGF